MKLINLKSVKLKINKPFSYTHLIIQQYFLHNIKASTKTEFLVAKYNIFIKLNYITVTFHWKSGNSKVGYSWDYEDANQFMDYVF